MNKRYLPISIFVLLYLFFALYVLSSSQHLPERMATHFNGRGDPNGWMERAQLTKVTLLIGMAFPLFIAFLNWLPRFYPDALNIPQRDYWLAAERREATFEFIFVHSWWFACMSVSFMFALHALLVAANRSVPVQLSMKGLILLVGASLTGMALWVFTLIRHFRRPGRVEPLSA